MSFNLGIVGATGVTGEVALRVHEEREKLTLQERFNRSCLISLQEAGRSSVYSIDP